MTPRDVWQRFDDEVSDRLLRGMAAAFALVATADVDIAEEEVQRFLQLVREEPSLRRVDPDAIEPLFRELAQALMDEPDVGRPRALEIVRESRRHGELIVAAAQMAIVADSHLVNVEELALREICEALGLDPSTH